MARKVYTIKLHGGRIGIQFATKAEIKRSVGTDNIRSIEPTTADDAAWVRGMGGYVPSQFKPPRSQHENRE